MTPYTRPRTLFLSAPIWEGQKCRGVGLAPTLIKAAGADHLEWRASAVVESHGTENTLSEKLSALRTDVSALIGGGERPIVVGGDHSLSIGSVSGALRANPDLGVIWIDAHGDLNTPRTSLSGNLHGMPLGFLLGLCSSRERLEHFAWLKERLLPSRLCLIGVRDLDPAETKTLEQLGILFYTAQDVADYGANKVAANALEAMTRNGARGIHLSIDVDAVDPAEFAMTGTRVSGGLEFSDLIEITAVLDGGMISGDLVEFNPILARSHEELFRGVRRLAQWCDRVAGRPHEPWACAI